MGFVSILLCARASFVFTIRSNSVVPREIANMRYRARLARALKPAIIRVLTPMTQTQKSRREVLEQFVAEKPTDAFARYGLALECMKVGDNDAATDHFQKLLEANPGYVAGYFQFGQHLSRIGKPEQARKLFSDGILVAQKAGDMHARDEMQAALALMR